MVWVYGGVSFLSAFLLFWTQPLAARGVLPALGGAPAVWNTCMVFFQVLLLAGYAYAHWLAARRSFGTQVLVHLVVLAVALVFPGPGLRPAAAGGLTPEGMPVAWLLVTLVTSLALPFFALSANAPLLQRWFGRSGHARAADPFFLYAASNAGSLGGLLAFPSLLEPGWTLGAQAEGWRAEVYEILIQKVHEYEGTANELTGDGTMALFGAPIALEDAPQRAIRSALAIHREINKFSDQLKGEKRIPPIKMRIGIHTGPVVVGTLGNDLRVEFKAVGDTVNFASRMEGLANPGTTYVTDDTFRLTEGFFRFEALGERQIKGKEEPVRIYRAITPSTRRTRFDVSAERGLTPFVGREHELELMLDGFEESKQVKGKPFPLYLKPVVANRGFCMNSGRQ